MAVQKIEPFSARRNRRLAHFAHFNNCTHQNRHDVAQIVDDLPQISHLS